MISAQQALQQLKQGNQRFINGAALHQRATQDEREQLLAGQSPFAIVLGCSDSRVPTEMIFDQGVGDLFVIRVAGNIATPSQIGSIEYAAAELGTPLVVVLGHSQCGAVKATLSEIENPSQHDLGNLGSIVNHIQPPLQQLWDAASEKQPDALMQDAVRVNVNASVQNVRQSPVIQRLMQNNGLVVIGAEYSLATGAVDFFDDVSENTEP